MQLGLRAKVQTHSEEMTFVGRSIFGDCMLPKLNPAPCAFVDYLLHATARPHREPR